MSDIYRKCLFAIQTILVVGTVVALWAGWEELPYCFLVAWAFVGCLDTLLEARARKRRGEPPQEVPWGCAAVIILALLAYIAYRVLSTRIR